MHIVRYKAQNQVKCGIVKDNLVAELAGSVLDPPQETGVSLPLAEVELLAPVEPGKIVCVGQNYIGHIKELGLPVPQQPVIFLKPASGLIGPGAQILYPPQAKRVDYEGELAVVIARTMTRVAESRALDHVLGYSCFNDVTERDMAARDPFLLTLCKGFDTFGCLGPWLTTDLDPGNLNLRTLVNGEIKQDDNTGNCVFSVPKVLSFISGFMTLLPGDVVITGTPKGIGPIGPGDEVSVEIQGIGRLTNRVKA